MALQAFARAEELARSASLFCGDPDHRAHLQTYDTGTAPSIYGGVASDSSESSDETHGFNGSGTNEGCGAGGNHKENNEDIGKNAKTAGDKTNEKDKKENDDKSYWGVIQSFVVLDNRNVDPDAEVDEEDQRLEALEDEARRVAADIPAEPQHAPERASDEDRVETMKGCTGEEMRRIFRVTRTRAEMVAKLTQKRLELARSIAFLQSEAEKVKEASLMVAAKRLFLEQVMSQWKDKASRYGGGGGDDGGGSDGSGDEGEANDRGENQEGGNDRNDEEHGQEDDTEVAGPTPIVVPELQESLSTAAKQGAAKTTLRRVRGLHRWFSGEDPEVADSAPEARYADPNMAGPSTIGVPHPPDFLLAPDIDTARRAQDIPRESIFFPSALSLPLHAPFPVLPGPEGADFGIPPLRAPGRRTRKDLKAQLFPGGVSGLTDNQPSQLGKCDTSSHRVPYAGPSQQGKASRPPGRKARIVEGAR